MLLWQAQKARTKLHRAAAEGRRIWLVGRWKEAIFGRFPDNLYRIHPPGTPAGGTKYNTGQKRFLYRSRMMSVRGESGLVGKLVKKPVDQD